MVVIDYPPWNPETLWSYRSKPTKDDVAEMVSVSGTLVIGDDGPPSLVEPTVRHCLGCGGFGPCECGKVVPIDWHRVTEVLEMVVATAAFVALWYWRDSWLAYFGG